MRSPRSIHNLLRRRRLFNIVQHAQSLVGDVGLRAHHPERNRASVDVNQKLLRRCADGELGKVLALSPKGDGSNTLADSGPVLGLVGTSILVGVAGDDLAEGRGNRVRIDVQTGEGLVVGQKTVVGGLVMMSRMDGIVVVSRE